MDVKIVGDDPLAYKKVAMNCDHRLDTDASRFPMALQSFVSGFNLLINGRPACKTFNLNLQLHQRAVRSCHPWPPTAHATHSLTMGWHHPMISI